ncbi:MCE family protein [Rhodococcus tukisamuensis]|uniref:Phospholipid/cholesterol/gamma-HCH transport system substrate-binding protein n=1 Tax=Rhodococcus tukisamuensis TaxID=168276 RepID=A0A1G6NN01_9NOCA|nr:MCE family protein [Rhodococcus tukisamuensis]SDC69119.1 phospholipid/cholesterol/gamma-HCH transport system substrate-binding protein [Rhodococcus tukisamuensis]
MSEPMADRKKWLLRGGVAAVVIAALVAGALVLFPGLGKNTITAYFPTTTGIYAGDDVRVLGVTVGKIESIDPSGDSAKVVMNVDRSVEIPADAKAIIVAPSLVAARFIQLTPVFEGGEEMTDGAEIPVERTAIPVEWDEIKTELTKLSTALGPQGSADQGSLGTFIDTAADNLDGNGDSLRATLRELSDTMKTLSDGRSDLFSTIRNLQTFVTALSSSNEQIVQFGGRLASVSSLLAENSDELGTALTDLDVAMGDVQRFVSENSEAISEQVGRLADATQVLAQKRPEIERVLHIAPNALANFNNIYNPAQGSLQGALATNNTANPINAVCGMIRGLENNNSDRSADLCTEFFGPVLNSVAVNYPGFLTNPALGAGALPGQIVYSPPSLEGSVPARTAKPIAGPLAGLPTIDVPKDLEGLLKPGGGR